MIHLGLNPTKTRAYEAALRASHAMRVTVTVYDASESAIHSIRPRIMSGAVQMDATQDVTRSLTLVCLDPAHKLHFDGNSAAEGSLYADNFIGVEYGVHVDDGDFWVDVPVFFGPITSFERQGPEVTIEAQGKESLGRDPHLVLNGYTIPRGLTVAKAIQNVMNRLGERRYALTGLGGSLHAHRAVHPEIEPWAVVVGGGTDATGAPIPGLVSKARGSKYVFYNGRGVLTYKNKQTSNVWTFNGRCVTSQPTVTYDITQARNHVEVTGGTPKNSKHHFRGHASLPASHPLSPQALARHGKPRYLVTFFSSDSLKSNAACRRKAQALLVGAETVTAQLESLVIPHLEENDTVSVSLQNVAFSFPLKQFTIPLTADTAMSVGWNKPIKPRRPRKGH